MARLNESGYTNDDGSDETAVEIIGYGTERGRSVQGISTGVRISRLEVD